MSKSDAILELQEILSNWKMITEDLDEDITNLKTVLEANEFIPTTLGEIIKSHLEMIAKNQVDFSSKYEALNRHKPVTEYNVLIEELEEQKRIQDANGKYLASINFFMSLHSEDTETEGILENKKEELYSYDLEDIDNDSLKEIAEPYILLQEAFLEENLKKKFSLTLKLVSYFEEEIMMGIQFNSLIIKDTEIEKKETTIEKNEEIEDSEITLDDTEEEIVSSKTDVDTDEELEDEDELNVLLTEDVASTLHVEMSAKAKSKFGVKEFKRDITKQYPGTKLECMVEALDGCGYTVESIALLKNGNIKEYETATDKLFQLGYLKKYKVEDLGEFYTLASRGERVFGAKDALAFINQHMKDKVSPIKGGEPIEDTLNSAIVRLLAFESIVKQKTLIPNYHFKVKLNVMGTDFFVSGYPNPERKNIIWFAGVITDEVEQLLEYKECICEKILEKDILVISGLSQEKTKAIAQWTFENLESECAEIAYTILGEEGIFYLDTDEALLIDNEEFDFDSKESTEETASEESEDNVTAEESQEELEENFVEEVLIEENEEEIVEQELEEYEEDVEEAEIESESNETKEEPFTSTDDKDDSKYEVYESKIAVSTTPSLSEEEKKQCISAYQKMIILGKTYAASAYLKALTKTYSYFEPHYGQLAYAVNDPMASCTYSSDTIFNVFYGNDELVSDYFILAATLRNYFLDQYSYDYSIQQLYTTISNNPLLRENQPLETLIYDLMTFKIEQHKGVDRYADYREKERGTWEKRLVEIRREAKDYYNNYGAGNLKENASHKRFIETTKLLLGVDSDLCQYLNVVVEDDREMLDMLQDFLINTYVKDQAAICEENIDPAKINEALDKYWELAAQNMRVVKKTSDLMSSLRMNLYKKVHKVVAVLCNYVFIMNSSFTSTEDASLHAYKKLRSALLNNIKQAIDVFSNSSSKELKDVAGRTVLIKTLKELEQRLIGEYREGSYKYYYIDFLKNDKILLDEDFVPILDEVLELPDYSVVSRIQKHCDENEEEFAERLEDIFAGGDDYGSASLILKYLSHKDENLSDEEFEKYDVEKAIVYPLKDLDNKRKEFIEDVELAQSYGQIDNTVENSKETILQIVEGWYVWAKETQNYGFFMRILEEFRKKIKNDAQHRATDLENSLNVYLDKNTSWEDDELISKAVGQIRERIDQQNYAAAEDLLNRVLTQDLDLDVTVQQEDYLSKFLDEYDVNYRKTANSGATLKSLVSLSKTNKDNKGGNRLLENWPRCVGSSDTMIKSLLSALGFDLESVRSESPILGKIDNYTIILKRPQNGRKSNYKHPISAFGSEAEEKGFRVVCIFGKVDASRLIDIFKEVGNAKNTLVLLDYALSLADRRTLARKTKTDISGKIFAVIDRVVLVYLAKHYAETAINRMLMSIVMPFASYQPYIDKSADVMPQEIFIGRKYELEKIESPTGVNIVYGGRQLGKSALLRMAKKDIDRDENGDRAILVDLKGIDYKAAAKKISAAMYDEGIFKEEYITDDWNELARDIKKRLRSETDYIPYLLLLMDEADVFIESCEAVGYQPFDALKDIQSIGSGRFKFVVAGLRNIVRFKREAALGNNSVLTHLESLTVKPFKSMEARELLEVPLSYLGFRFPKDNETEVLVSTIFGTTNYFPGLLQLYCTKLIEAMRRDYAGYSESETPPYIVKKDHIKKVLAEQSLQQDIREKFFITLKVGEDDYYYIIALLVAYHYHENKSQNGCSANELIELAETYSIGKIAALNGNKLEALMEEMRELNVLQHTGDGRYRFTRHSFCQMMGTVQQIDDELLNYMED